MAAACSRVRLHEPACGAARGCMGLHGGCAWGCMHTSMASYATLQPPVRTAPALGPTCAQARTHTRPLHLPPSKDRRLTLDSLADMSPGDIGAMVRHPAAGVRVAHTTACTTSVAAVGRRGLLVLRKLQPSPSRLDTWQAQHACRLPLPLCAPSPMPPALMLSAPAPAPPGERIKACVDAFPYLQLGASLQPITRTVLRISLTITPQFVWLVRWAGSGWGGVNTSRGCGGMACPVHLIRE